MRQFEIRASGRPRPDENKLDAGSVEMTKASVRSFKTKRPRRPVARISNSIEIKSENPTNESDSILSSKADSPYSSDTPDNKRSHLGMKKLEEIIENFNISRFMYIK